MTLTRTVGIAFLSLAVVACETDQPTEAERGEIVPLIRSFLVSLAAAYGQMDAAPLEGIAAPRLMEQALRDINLLRAGGDRLEPVLIDVEVTSLKVLRHVNAYLACTETWDTRRFDSYSGELVGHDPHTVLHTYIQLKKVKREWLVLYREVEETATGPRFVVPTPTPG